MSQSSIYAYFLSIFTEDELEVAGTMLELSRQVKFYWGAKRRRSVLPPIPPAPPVAVSCTCGIGVAVAPSLEPEKSPVKVEASSPLTPLSFPPSEPEEKRLIKKVPVRKKKEKLLDLVKERTQENELLKKELVVMRDRYEKLKEENLILKEELSVGIGRGKRKLDSEISETLNLDMKLKQPTFESVVIASNPDNHHNLTIPQLTSVVDRTAMKAETSKSYLLPCGQTPSLFAYSGELGMINENAGPQVVPDLNVPLGESLWMNSIEPVDRKSQSRVETAALARQRRMQVCREKNSRLHLRHSHSKR